MEFKVGDIVMINLERVSDPDGCLPFWYLSGSFKVLEVHKKGVFGQTIRVDRDFPNSDHSDNYGNNKIYAKYLDLDIKQMRMKKLKQLECTSLIETTYEI